MYRISANKALRVEEFSMDCTRCYALQRIQSLKNVRHNAHIQMLCTFSINQNEDLFPGESALSFPRRPPNQASVFLNQMQGQKCWRTGVRYPSEDPMEVWIFLQSGLTEAKHHPHNLRPLKAETITALFMLCIWIALKQIYVLEK